jgi:CheY-like chemotaxis protein
MTTPINIALLIDDDEIDQRLYVRVIERSNLVGEVKSFLYADEALSYLVENPGLDVDIIFLDINMPRMNGFEFLQRATEQLGTEFVKTVVVMLTTSLNPDDRKRAESFDVVKQFLNKPLTVEHIEHAAKLISHNQ